MVLHALIEAKSYFRNTTIFKYIFLNDELMCTSELSHCMEQLKESNSEIKNED